MTINAQAPSIAERLSLIGGAGAALLGEALQSRQNTSVVSTDHGSASATTIIQSQALVWFAISLAVPVDIGKELMDDHIRKTNERLAKTGCQWTLQKLEAQVVSSWMALVVAQESSGAPMLGVCRAVLEGCTGRQDRDIVGSMELLPAITEIMSSTRATVLAEYPAYDTEPGPSDSKIGTGPRSSSVENAMVPPTSAHPTPMAQEVGGDAAIQRENSAANVSLVLGLLSIFSWPFVIIPILAMITGSAGLAKSKERRGKGKVKARVGVGLGVFFAIVHIVYRIGITA